MIDRGRKGERDNQDRWLLTYADMITLLLAFFIMMYSMSVLNLSKFREAAVSIRSGFGGEVRGQGRGVLLASSVYTVSPSPVECATGSADAQLLKPLVDYIHTQWESKGADIGEDQRGIVITLLSDRVLFRPGSASLDPRAYPLLDKIAETLDKVVNKVQVEGHTCNLRPRQSRYPSNWELSTARATNVLRYLVETKGLESSRFSAAGYGSVRSVAKNDSDSNRRKNRRVEIVILRPEPTPSLEAGGPARKLPHAEIRRID